MSTPTEEAVPLPPPQGLEPVSAEGNAELGIDNDTPSESTLEFEGLTSHIAGTWELAGDRKYGHCFFIVTQFQ